MKSVSPEIVLLEAELINMAKAKSPRTGRSFHHKQSFTAVYHKTDKWWVAYVEEIPGANTQGKTKAEARRNLREAVQMIIQINREQTEHDLEGAQVLREKLTVAL